MKTWQQRRDDRRYLKRHDLDAKHAEALIMDAARSPKLDRLAEFARRAAKGEPLFPDD